MNESYDLHAQHESYTEYDTFIYVRTYTPQRHQSALGTDCMESIYTTIR